MADPTQAEIDAYYKDLYQGKGGHISKADVDKVKQQILSQGLTDKWKGQGFGSADANALDMAKSLVASGITDIKQLGQGTYYEPKPVNTRYVTNNGYEAKLTNGKYYIYENVINPYTGENDFVASKEVDPNTITKQYGLISPETSGGNNSDDITSTIDVFHPLTAEQQKKVKTNADGTMTVPVAMGEGIINKDTGQKILSNYNERTQGNAFGGTYAGEGNTAYRVQFDAKGNPFFYTTAASSNDLLNILQGNPILNTVANIAAAYFGGPLGTAALQAAQGKDINDILKAAALSWAGGQAGAYLSGSETLVDVLGRTGANIAANAAKSFVTSEGRIDPVAALLSGGFDAGTGAILGNIPGFEGLDKGTQALVTKAISTTLRTGKLDPVSLAKLAYQAGTSAMANATNTPTEAQTNLANDEFLKTLEPYLTSSPTDAQLQNEFLPDTKGDWNEITGKFIPDANGGTTYGQINPQTSGNVNNMKDWSVDSTGQWTRTDPVTGEKTVYEYKTPITGTAQTGADIMNKSGAGPTASNPAAKSPTAKSPTAGTPTGAPTTGTPTGTSPSPTVTRFGLDPLDVLKMKNDVAHINPLEELFGGSIYDKTPASSAHDQTDIVEAATGGQVYSGGGDIHALLQLLRS